MKVFAEFWKEYGVMILHTIFTLVAGGVGIIVKNIYKKFVHDKTKRDVVHTCVQAIEQIYKDLHGQEKFEKVESAAAAMLREKGIEISDVEMRVLIEAAVGEFNRVFEKTKDGDTPAVSAPPQGDAPAPEPVPAPAPTPAPVPNPAPEPAPAPTAKGMTCICTPTDAAK